MTETTYSQRIDSHHHLWRYTPEEYGLSADRIRSEYDFYIKQYGVEIGR